RFLPLARQLARRYQRAGEPLDDLLQVASLGLIKAIDRFDPEREVAFSSYAVPTILGEIKRHFRDRTWSVRVPRDLQELSLKVDRTVVAMSKELQRSPTVTELADKLDCTEEQVLEAMEAGGARPGARGSGLTGRVAQLLREPVAQQREPDGGRDRREQALDVRGDLLGLVEEQQHQPERLARDHDRHAARVQAVRDAQRQRR